MPFALKIFKGNIVGNFDLHITPLFVIKLLTINSIAEKHNKRNKKPSK